MISVLSAVAEIELIFFDKLYAQMNEAEKREFLSQLVDNVQIYEERKENGQWLKSIEFKLPIIEKEFTLSLDNDTQNETVVLLSKGARQRSGGPLSSADRSGDSHSVHRRRKMRLCRRLGILELYRLWISSIIC